MQISFNPYISKSSSNSVSFQAGEWNHKFTKHLKDATTNMSDAKALHYLEDEGVYTFSPERYEQLKNAVANTESAQFYINKLKEKWSKLAKNMGITIN